jgi:hypothetical protein
MKNFLLLLLSGYIFFCNQIYGQGSMCGNAQQMCFESGVYSYPASTGGSSAGSNIGCLGSAPNGRWFYLQVGESGRINIRLWTIPIRDIDFAAWGPFAASSFENLVSTGLCSLLTYNCQSACQSSCVTHGYSNGANPSNLGGYPCGNMIDCSYDASAVEFVHLPNLIPGDFYIILITNFSNLPTQIYFNIDTTSTGAVTCLPQSFLRGDTACVGETAHINVINPHSDATYTYEGPNNFSQSSTSPNLTILNAQMENAGTYSLVITPNGGSALPPLTAELVIKILPNNAQNITGEDLLCQNDTLIQFSVPNIDFANSYLWTLPQGASGNSDSNTIIVSFDNTALSGDITVKGINECGQGMSSTHSIIVNPIPPTPIITQNGNVLSSDATAGNQWYNQDGIISGATHQNYSPISNGDYYVIVTLLECNSEPSNEINVTISNIQTNETKVMNLYPNPVSKELIIEIKGNTEIEYFEIFNSLGQIVFKGEVLEKTQIQTSSFASGKYYVKLKNGNILEFIKTQE